MADFINFKEYFGFLDYSKSEFDRSNKRVPFSREMEGVYLSKDFEIGTFPGSEDFITGINKTIYYQTTILNRNVRIPIFYTDDGIIGSWYYYNKDTKAATLIGNVQGGGIVQADQMGDTLVLASTAEKPKKLSLSYVISDFSNYPPTYTADTSTIQSVNSGDSVTAYSKPGIVASCDNRLWFIYRGQLYYSAWSDLDTWDDTVDNQQKASLFEFTNNFGDATNLYVLDNDLVVVFEDGIISITGYSPIDEVGNDPFQTSVVTSDYGSRSPYSFVQSGSSLVFLNNKRKVVKISKAQTLGSGTTLVASPVHDYLSKPVQKIFDLIPDECLPYVHATNIEHLQLIGFSFHKGFTNFPIDDDTRVLFKLDSLTDKARTGLTLTKTPNSVKWLIESVDAGTNTLTITAHPFSNNDVVYVSTLNTIIDPLVAGTAYHVINKATNTIQLSATQGGSAINITDSGTGDNFVCLQGTILDTNGVNNLIGSAKKFDGYGYLRNSSSDGSKVGVPYTSFTVDTWIKPDVLPTSGNKAYIYNEDTTSGNFSVYLHNDGGVQKVCGALEGNTVCSVTHTCSLTAWTYISFTWSGTVLTVYVNATESNTEDGNILDVSGSEGICIGAKYDSGATSYFQGSIACIRVQDSALDQSDIDILYSEISTSQNRYAFYDYEREGWSVVTDSIKASSSLYLEGRWFTGTVDGKIKEQLKGYTHTLLGSDIRELRYQLERLTLGKGFNGFDKIEFTLEDFNEGILYFEFVWNKETPNISRKQILITSDMGSNVIGRKKKFEIYPRGRGEWLDLTIYSSKEDFTWKITSMLGYPRQ